MDDYRIISGSASKTTATAVGTPKHANRNLSGYVPVTSNHSAMRVPSQFVTAEYGEPSMPTNNVLPPAPIGYVSTNYTGLIGTTGYGNNSVDCAPTEHLISSPAGFSPIDVHLDFTRPDDQRTRPLIIDGRKLYVDEHYISVWSPVLSQWCIECPDRELIFANVSYEHALEMLFSIHPTYKNIDEQNVHHLLPLAFDYQMDGLLHRCECFLIATKMSFLEKVWLADRFQLNRLLTLLLRELNPQKNKLDLTSPQSRYHSFSDRVKVLLLERIHGAPMPDELPEPPADMDAFVNATNLHFAAVRAKSGRVYYVNPYYMAAWSTVFSERLKVVSISSLESGDPIYCPVTHDELRYFLQAIHPPQLRITESNVAPVLMSASKMESAGLLRKCAQMLLDPKTQLSVFVRLSLLDRCRLTELLDQCLSMVYHPQNIVDMSQQQTYECLSIRSRAAMMDRMSRLVKQQQHQGGVLGERGRHGGNVFNLADEAPLPQQQHFCNRCKSLSGCSDVTWMCPTCKTYTEKQPFSQQQTSTAMAGEGQSQVVLGNGATGHTPVAARKQRGSIDASSAQQNQRMQS